MFGFKKKNKFEVASPVNGECISITEVKDKVFSKKMMGQGFAVIPNEDNQQVVAPISGKVVVLPESEHAVGIRSIDYDVEVLVHIGLDTVSLAGQGFSALVKIGDRVTVGQPIVNYDAKAMKLQKIDMTTIVIFTSGYTSDIQLGKKRNTKIDAGNIILIA